MSFVDIKKAFGSQEGDGVDEEEKRFTRSNCMSGD